MTTSITAAPPITALPEPTGPRWRPLRGGLQNLWQYDHATRLVFHGGRLLLRGRNGSGKTKAVELLLPFLFEGSLQPSRLDPFGTRSRKMHYNLLHEANRDLTVNVGYAWLEFGRLDGGRPRYTTIGAGLRARRGTDTVDSWFFVVSDRRVDVDLKLIDADLRPLARGPLDDALGDDGRVYPSARDYRAAVNKALFGLPPAQYAALVEALLRLRQPHLSERLEPAEVAQVLADSLPPLDSERVREVAEGFERLEAHRRELDDRRRALRAIAAFLNVYRSYARTVAAARARDLTRADSRVRAAADQISQAQQAHDQARQRASALAAEQKRIAEALAGAETRIHTLETSDEYRAVQDLERAEQDERDTTERAEAVRSRADRDAAAAEQARARRDAAARQAGQQRERLTVALRAADGRARAADLLRDHDGVAAQLDAVAQRRVTTAAAVRAAIDSVVAARLHGIRTVRAAVAALREAEEQERRAVQRLEDADEEVRDAEGRAADADQAAAVADDAHRDAVLAWAGALGDPIADDDALEALLDVDAPDRQTAARRLAEPVRERLDAARADAAQALRDARRALDATVQERDALAAVSHEPPRPPAWRRFDRTGRAGAPLYLLAEFTDALDRAAQARVEAALEAAGLLDAWVTPDGRLLDPGTLDTVLVAMATTEATRTLVDVVRPTPHGGVPAGVVEGVLRAIELAHGTPRTEHWVTSDGCWALGPLRGAAAADEVRYVGETARAEARRRRLADLEARIATQREEVAAAARAEEAAATRARRLDDDLDAFPAVTGVLGARAAAVQAAIQLSSARDRRDNAARYAEQAAHAAAEARIARDETAAAAGLAAHVDRLDELEAASREWRDAVRDCAAEVDNLVIQFALLDDREQAVADAEGRAAHAAADAERAAKQARAAQERAATLQAMIGATRYDLLARLRTAREDRKRLDDERDANQADQRQAAQVLGEIQGALRTATAEHQRLQGERTAAAEAFRALAALGLLEHVLERLPDGDPTSWSIRTALEQAREAARHGRALPDEPGEVANLLDADQNTMARKQQELQRDLVAGIRLFPRADRGVIVHDVQYAGRTYRLQGLVAELSEDVEDRDTRLARDEQDLLEQFLSGELHEHLRGRIRDAHALVRTMNDQLAGCPTPAGHRVRLDWRVDDEAPAGTGQAVELLMRGSHLLSDDDRAALRTFLHQQLRAAREGEAAASLSERIATAFDYRRWYAFTVQFRDGTVSGWRRLTRQTHGTGSGGEKAVMLHLPLFAAMAAHYAASPASPRLIVLDEVFAGIDRGTRGQLMALLVALDLDALLTSHEEWGFYAELDALSTYHLVRDPDIPGVHAEWFVWDGGTRWEMGS